MTREEIEWKISFLEDEIAEISREIEELDTMLDESEEEDDKV